MPTVGYTTVNGELIADNRAGVCDQYSRLVTIPG
jgi:hypothetical protein